MGTGTYSEVKLYKTRSDFVAIKFSTADPIEGIDSSFIREAACMIKMSHPNVIKLQDVILYPNLTSSIALVLPVAKDNLSSMINIFSISERKSVALQILRGAAYIQSHGIAHGDYKPANILIYECQDPYMYRAVIADFGLARCANCSSLSGTFFTVSYRAPELFLGGKYGVEADIWALGVILIQLFTSDLDLFYSKSHDESEQLRLIFQILGTPT